MVEEIKTKKEAEQQQQYQKETLKQEEEPLQEQTFNTKQKETPYRSIFAGPCFTRKKGPLRDREKRPGGGFEVRCDVDPPKRGCFGEGFEAHPGWCWGDMASEERRKGYLLFCCIYYSCFKVFYWLLNRYLIVFGVFWGVFVGVVLQTCHGFCFLLQKHG